MTPIETHDMECQKNNNQNGHYRTEQNKRHYDKKKQLLTRNSQNITLQVQKTRLTEIRIHGVGLTKQITEQD